MLGAQLCRRGGQVQRSVLHSQGHEWRACRERCERLGCVFTKLTQDSAAECVSDLGKEHCSAIGGECMTEQDGYYYVSMICVTFGVLFLVGYIMPTARRLQSESIEAICRSCFHDRSCSPTSPPVASELGVR